MPTSILDLPFEVRRKIYYCAGLFSQTEKYITLSHDWYKNHQYQATWSLLLVCKTFYDEVSTILYPHGRFIVGVKQISDLAVLSRFRPCTFQKLRFLSIHLQITSCLPLARDEDCCGYRDPCRLHMARYDAGFDTLSTKTCDLFRAWSITIMHVLTNVNPDQFSLSLVSDGESREAAKLAVAPLITRTPLAKCSIRLSRLESADLQSLARQTALQLMGIRFLQETPFRYPDLPPEIRRRILEYTDLVTPLGEVEWTPSTGFQLNNEYEYGMCRAPWCPPYYHYSCQFRKCRSNDGDGGCFCRRYHSAYSPHCICWTPPSYLFLVCRLFRDEAEEVFYRKNRVIVTPVHRHDVPKTNPTRFEASLFLETIRTSALRHLRFLEIVFPPFEPGYCHEASAVLSDWQNATTLLAEQCCLSALTIRIYFANFHYNGDGVGRFHAQMNLEGAKVIMEAYRCILVTISKLSSLRHLYFHLLYPIFWIASQRRMQERYGYNRVKQNTREMEDTLGRKFFGERFEALTCNEEIYEPSLWLQWYEQMPRSDYPNPWLQ